MVVYNLDKSAKVCVGYISSCALAAKKAVKCWGDNSAGQLGTGTTIDSLKAREGPRLLRSSP